MDDIQELYYLFPEIKEHISIEKKVGQGTLFIINSKNEPNTIKAKLTLKERSFLFIQDIFVEMRTKK